MASTSRPRGVAEVVAHDAGCEDRREAARRRRCRGQPATALVVGYDQRAGEGRAAGRARTRSCSSAPIPRRSRSRCSRSRATSSSRSSARAGRPSARRINAAYSECGTKGTLETVRKLTGLPINYLITVNFRGFRQLVDAVGGIWIDVDRRYFNDRGGDFGYATINLFPGYQKLSGYQALDFVRYRHTDSDLYRIARQQLFVRAFKDQVKLAARARSTLPKLVNDDHEERRGRRRAAARSSTSKTVLRYALFAYGLPPGHFFQSKIEGLEETARSTCSRPQENIQQAVQEFAQPGRRVAGEGDRRRARTRSRS